MAVLAVAAAMLGRKYPEKRVVSLSFLTNILPSRPEDLNFSDEEIGSGTSLSCGW